MVVGFSKKANRIWLIAAGIVFVVVLALYVYFVYIAIRAGSKDKQYVGWKDANAQNIDFKYPDNIGTKYISTIDWPPKLNIISGQYTCTPGGSETARAGGTIAEKIGKNDFCVTRESEGAAGSIYVMYAYAFPLNDKTGIFTFSLRFVQCDNYDEPNMSECKTERETFDPNIIVGKMFDSIFVK